MTMHDQKNFYRPAVTYKTFEGGKEVIRTIPAKPRGKVASQKDALARAPKNGWDAAIDKAAARKHFSPDGLAFKFHPDRVDMALSTDLHFLHSIGIHPKTAAKFIIAHWGDAIMRGAVTKVEIVDAAKNFYAKAKKPPGESSKAGQGFDTDKMKFKVNKERKPIASDPYNIGVALARLGIKMRYDEFEDRYMIEGLEGYGPVLQDKTVNRIRFLCHKNYEFFPTEDLVYKYLLDQGDLNRFNSAADYFDSLEWDGKARLDTVLIDYAGATDTPYVRAVGKLPFVAAVRRVRQPGAKFDEMLVLESAQGKNKSSALELMAIKPNWFTDSLPLNARNQETLEHVEGKLFVECAELQGMKKGEIEHVKAMLSRTVDRGRPAYGRLQKERARQFVFIGTSNGQSYLRDETGNRRFWPVAVKTFDVAALKRDRDQIWAEAAFVEDMGESIRLDPSLWEAAGIEQRRRLEIVADPYTDAFRHYLGDRAGKIATPDLWAILGIDDAGRRTPDQNKRFGAALKACGWQAKTIWVGGQSTRGYVRGVQSGPEGWRRIVVTRGPDRRPLVEYDDERETPSDSFET